MRDPSVVKMSEASARSRARRRMRDLAAAARTAALAAADPDAVHPAFEEPTGGRAWLNGSELGGARYGSLDRAYD